MSELYIGEFRVNVARSEVVYQENIATLEPKVLKLLLLLAEKPGEIVPHQTILDHVWPDVVVEANTVQRCIALLRKTFNDNAKTQSVITTHPRVGYSLVASVSRPEAQESSDVAKPPVAKYSGVVILLLIFVVISLLLWPGDKLPIDPMDFKHITPLTTTDAREYRASFSPDGQFIVYQRQGEGLNSNLYGKNLSDNSEILLTAQSGIFGKPAWSPQSNQLAFTQTLEGGCNTIQLLSFTLAKSTPQSGKSVLGCVEHTLVSVTWLDDQTIAYAVHADGYSEVALQNINSRQSSTLYRKDHQYPYALAFDQRQQKLAIMQSDTSKKSSLVFLQPGASEYETVEITVPARFRHQLWDRINWHPQQNHLLTASDQSLFIIDESGQFSEYPVPTYEVIYDPVYHPDGQSIAATMGIADFDNAELNWGLDQPTSQVLNRSSVSDRSAKYQPGGKGMAFISRRSGSSQLWFTATTDNKTSQKDTAPNDGLRQLSRLTAEDYLQSFVWSNKGNLMALNVNNQLRLLDINGESQTIEHPFKVLQVFQWIGNDQILLSVSNDNIAQVALFDISTSDLTALYQGVVSWAQMDDTQTLFVSNFNGQVYEVDGEIAFQDDKVADSDDKIPLEALSSLFVQRRFLIDGSHLVLNDNKGYIWQYNFADNSLNKINNITLRSQKLNDIDWANQRLLYLSFVAGDKEIVLFH